MDAEVFKRDPGRSKRFEAFKAEKFKDLQQDILAASKTGKKQVIFFARDFYFEDEKDVAWLKKDVQDAGFKFEYLLALELRDKKGRILISWGK